MEEKILTEITEHCENCPLCQKCPEEECVLWRIEQLIAPQSAKKEEEVIEGQTTIDEFIAS